MKKTIQEFFRKEWKIILIIGGIALLLRLTLFGFFVGRGVYDSWKFDYGDGIYYTQVAKNMLYHGTVSIDQNNPPVPDSLRTPLYSILLIPVAFFHLSLAVPAFIQDVCVAMLMVLFYFVLRKLFGHRIAFFTALIVAIEPYWIFLSNRIIAEPLFIPLFIGAHLCLLLFLKDEKPSYVYASSILFALAALTRPVGFYFFIFVPVIIWLQWYRKKSYTVVLKHIALSCVCFVLILAPWFIRNKITLHSWSISSVQEYNLFEFNGKPFCVWLGSSCDESFHEAERMLPEVFDQRYADAYKKAGISLILNHPFAYALFALRSVPHLFLDNAYVDIAQIFSDKPLYTEQGLTEAIMRHDFQGIRNYFSNVQSAVFIIVLIGKLFFIALALLAVSALRLLFIKKFIEKKAVLFLFASIALYAVLSAPIGSPRLRTPILPFMVLLAAISLSWHDGSYHKTLVIAE